MDGKPSLKWAWLSHVNALNLGGNHRTTSLERLIVSVAVNFTDKSHKFLKVVG